MATETRTLVERWLEAGDSADLDAFDACLHHDVVAQPAWQLVGQHHGKLLLTPQMGFGSHEVIELLFGFAGEQVKLQREFAGRVVTADRPAYIQRHWTGQAEVGEQQRTAP